MYEHPSFTNRKALRKHESGKNRDSLGGAPGLRGLVEEDR